MLDWTYSLEMLGTAVFAISGALAASRAGMDVFGYSVLAMMASGGGGTLRDIVLGRFPVFWVNDSNYALVAIGAAVGVFFVANRPGYRRTLLVWMDAAGLALFAVLGTEIALELGVTPMIAVMMGVATAVTGGMIRDIVCNEIPLVLTREIYATAAFAGSILFVLAITLGIDRNWALGISVVSGFLIRGFATRFGWSLPSGRKSE